MTEMNNTEIVEMTLGARLEMLEIAVRDLVAITQAQNELIGAVKDQVGPTIEALQNNPMFRMMFGGKD